MIEYFTKKTMIKWRQYQNNMRAFQDYRNPLSEASNNITRKQGSDCQSWRVGNYVGRYQGVMQGY
jgi:hypothetical protein